MGGMAIAGLGSAIGGIGGVFGASKQAGAAKESAQMQAYMSMLAMQQQREMYERTRNDLAPYRNAGEFGANMLTDRLGDLTKPFVADQATLSQTPGYQWNLAQGLKATQSAAAARGLGVSGAALKGAASYATGLADNTLKTQFDIDQTNKTNAYNKLMGTSQLGASAAAQTGLYGANAANQQTNLLTGIGNAYGAANMAGANAWGNALTGFGNTASGFAGLGLQSYLKGGGQQKSMWDTGGGYNPFKGWKDPYDDGGYA